jgi:ribonuclease HI
VQSQRDQEASDSEQKQQILKEKYKKHIKIYTDGSKKVEKVGFAVITPDKNFRKKQKPQNTIYSAEQVQQNNKTMSQNNLFYKGLKMFNEINDEIKNESELTEFKRKIEEYVKIKFV